jgi:5-formyltetrahydrofolate cyclo-ligase
MGETKASIRALAANRREALPAFERTEKSRRIQTRILEFSPYLDAPSIALYSPTGNEVATDRLQDHALGCGKKIFYPRLEAETIRWVRLHDRNDFVAGRYGILEPTGKECLAPDDIEGLVVFVPGVAFDTRGNRLGRGQGWYDRALAGLGKRATIVALAYDFQIIDRIPTDRWDRAVEYIVTEVRIIDCRNALEVSQGIPESLSMKRGC